MRNAKPNDTYYGKLDIPVAVLDALPLDQVHGARVAIDHDILLLQEVESSANCANASDWVGRQLRKVRDALEEIKYAMPLRKYDTSSRALSRAKCHLVNRPMPVAFAGETRPLARNAEYLCPSPR